jgi:hypothetical protein
MLTYEQNELVTRTGPATPMGNFLRRYWIPILLAEELPKNECPRVRVKLLSERLLAWRDSRGRYALIDEFCAHRGVSFCSAAARGWRGKQRQIDDPVSGLLRRPDGDRAALPWPGEGGGMRVVPVRFRRPSARRTKGCLKASGMEADRRARHC